MHRKMLNELKAQGKVPQDVKVSTTHLRDIIRLYGLEKFRAEVKAKKYDIPDFLYSLYGSNTPTFGSSKWYNKRYGRAYIQRAQ